MESDFRYLDDAMGRLGEVLVKVRDEIIEIFKETFINGFNSIRKILEDAAEILKKIKFKEKTKYKPVLKITPSKLYYKDKRLKNHYCRNNC